MAQKLLGSGATLLAVLVVAVGIPADALAGEAKPDPALVIRSGGKKVVYRRSELLKRKDVVTLEIDYDPAFPGKKLLYRAVPAHALFDAVEIPKDATIQFRCLDGFSGPMDQKKLLNTSSSAGSIAYLAMELPDEKWPAINPPVDTRTAAPFYLVWTDPKKSAIGREQWPFQLAGFEVKTALASAFPAIQVDPSLPGTHPARHGLEIFVQNCFPCHTLNQQGESQMGPDLNLPRNPTEYFTEPVLKAFIRNPQSLHHWPESRMAPFSKDDLSDASLTDLLAYLRHMAKRKTAEKPK
jgi:mono/diheme cytochrome c family protein